MKFEMKLDGIADVIYVLSPNSYKKAMNRTVRRLGSKFKKIATKEIRSAYNIKSKKLQQYIKVKTTTTNEGIEWRLTAKGRPLSLIHFGARKTRKGVSVRVKKSETRKVIKGAFIAKDMRGNLRVFKRVGKKRLPIDSKVTLSVPQMFNKNILEKAGEEIERNYEKEFKHNLDYYLGKFK